MTERTTRQQRTAFAATLALAMGIGPFAVNAISALSPFVIAELGLSRTELGSLASLAFIVAALTTVAAGPVVDRVDGRTMLLFVFVLGAGGAAVMAGARSLHWLWLGALLGGASQATANPTTNQLIADHAPPGRQGTLVGIKQSGVQMVQAMIGLVLPPLAVLVTWRGATLVGLVIAAVGLVAAWACIPRSTPHVTETPLGGRDGVGAGVWWLGAYTFTIGMCVQAVLVYTPLFAFERLGFAAALAGVSTGVLGVTGVAARIYWSRLVEHRDAPVNTLALIAVMAFVGVILILLSEHGQPWALWVGLVLFGGSAFGVNAVAMLTVVRTAGGGRTGRASGVIGLCLYLGFTAGPISFGALVDQTGSYTVGWIAVASLCGAALMLTAWWRRHQGV